MLDTLTGYVLSLDFMSSYQTRLIAKALLTVEVEPSLKEAAAKIAAANDDTLSRVVRRALREYVAAHAQMELPRAVSAKKKKRG